jgi:hypothetical protein
LQLASLIAPFGEITKSRNGRSAPHLEAVQIRGGDMPAYVNCPNCGNAIKCPDDAVGKRGRCGECKHVFRLSEDLLSSDSRELKTPSGERRRRPADDSETDRPRPKRRVKDDEEFDEPRSRDGRSPKKKGGALKWVLLALGAMFLVCGGGCGGLYWFVIRPAADKSKEFADRMQREIDEAEAKERNNRPAVTLAANDLFTNAAKFKDKSVSVKGVIRTGSSGRTGDSVFMQTSGKNGIICVLKPGEFTKILKVGRGGDTEINGVVTSTGPSVTLSNCTVVRAAPTPGIQIPSFSIAREFTQNAANAESKYKEKATTIAGRVESVAGDQIVLNRVRDKAKNTSKVIFNFGPDWQDALSKVKVGDSVSISAFYSSNRPGELEFEDSWLLVK